MEKTLDEVVEAANNILEEYQSFNYATVCSDLQATACEELSKLLGDLTSSKSQFIQGQDENAANTILGLECVTSMLLHLLTMWRQIKSGEAEQAWESLVKAQMAGTDAARAHEGFAHIEHFGHNLAAIEKLLFPPQIFNSIGMIVKSRKCSICDDEYGECSHLVGKPYMGELCHTVVTEIDRIDHISIVENPANKMCRITHVGVSGGRKNRMTLRVEPDAPDPEPQAPDAGVVCNAILQRFDDMSG